ncbi:alpha/beta hydrolase [Roseovarius sp. ZX-A-9]|uniref:alpha/beta hydrolase n=1 Tax=Roseovarius sp. ZX-A-9 TaxID=3014783 RepID=UPI00232D9C9A|nr:alpha/beta hydrolase [Roseovarius sp. ZX-A-9]
MTVSLLLLPLTAAASFVPTAEALQKYAEFEAALSKDTDRAFSMVDQLLAERESSDLRLSIGRAALRTGEAERAIAYLAPLSDVSPFPKADPRETEVYDMLSAAHRALGQMDQALRFDLLAYNSAEARLGAENRALLDRLSNIEARYNAISPDIIAAIEGFRRQIENVVPPVGSLRAEGDPAAVAVWYGTNRLLSGEADPARYFGSSLGPLSVGKLTVTIPPDHLAGLIERPEGWFFTDHLDPDEHVVLADIETLSHTAFAKACCGPDDKLMFVHGYNVSFHDGALRAAQLAFDLEFPGKAMYYSWPSQASVYGYLIDASNVLPTRPAMEQFLEIATRGEGKLHLIAHSMGNRYTLEALNGFFRNYPNRRMGQLILAAPDVDRADFEAEFESIRSHVDGITLYASQNDWALTVSRGVNGGRRLGDAGGNIVHLNGMDTVDASQIEADSLGHSYFGDAPEMLGDILGVVRNGWAPIERCGVAARPLDDNSSVWDVVPDSCLVEEVRTASDLIRLHGNGALEVAQKEYDDAPGDRLDFWLGVLEVVALRLGG